MSEHDKTVDITTSRQAQEVLGQVGRGAWEQAAKENTTIEMCVNRTLYRFFHVRQSYGVDDLEVLWKARPRPEHPRDMLMAVVAADRTNELSRLVGLLPEMFSPGMSALIVDGAADPNWQATLALQIKDELTRLNELVDRAHADTLHAQEDAKAEYAGSLKRYGDEIARLNGVAERLRLALRWKVMVRDRNLKPGSVIARMSEPLLGWAVKERLVAFRPGGTTVDVLEVEWHEHI